MPWESEDNRVNEYILEVFVWNDEKDIDKRLAYRIDETKETFTLFLYQWTVPRIEFKGFRQVPKIVHENGYFGSGLDYYLNKKLEEINATTVIVKRGVKSTARKVGNGIKVTLDYNFLESFQNSLKSINLESSRQKSQLTNDTFAHELPTRFKSSGASNQIRKKRVLENLDEEIIPTLNPEELTKVFTFIESLLQKRYKTEKAKRKLFGTAKLKVDEVAISEVIDDFKSMVKNNVTEVKWGNFLQKNLYLLDSKYVAYVTELNVMLGSQRRADFGMIDVDGFLDIFEIKRPTTKLLASKADHGNHYWSTDSAKAITQAEKYLYNAEGKKDALAADIKREFNLDVEITRPRAILIIGSSDQLNTRNKKEDFRVLRMSLKNIELVLYDELIQRLENQKGKIYKE